MSFSPDRLAVGRERWVVAGFVVALVVLIMVEVAHDFRPAKLSVVFMALVYGPLVALHEAGHAMACRALGWRILRVEIGQGRRLLGFRVGNVPVDVRWLPVGGFVVPAPVRLRRPRLESALIYAAVITAQPTDEKPLTVSFLTEDHSPNFLAGLHTSH